MKQILSGILLCIYLVGATEAYQLLKLPALVTHFADHRFATPGLDIATFLEMHYNTSPHDALPADWQQDMQLPFKTHGENFGIVPLSHFPPPPIASDHQPATWMYACHRARPADFYSGQHRQEIFQPPRMV